MSFHTIKYNHIDMTCDSSLLGIPFNKKKKERKKPKKNNPREHYNRISLKVPVTKLI